MQYSLRGLFVRMSTISLGLFFAYLLLVTSVPAQSTYTAQLTGVVSDSSGGVIPGAKVTLTDEATNISMNTVTDSRGIYVFTGLRPTTYSIRAEAPNLASQERKGVVLGVNQQASLDFTLSPGSVAESVTVTEQLPLLDTGNATLGTDVTNDYIKELPLVNRSMFALVFMAAGVTETTGSGVTDNLSGGQQTRYPTDREMRRRK